MIFLPFFLALVPEIPLTGQDVFLAALFGGALQGVGLGLVFAAGGTTGGTDLTATLLRDFFPGRSAAWILQLLDGAVVLLGAGTFGIQKALYAVVAVVVTSRVIDMMAEGLNFAKAAYIISEHAEELARRAGVPALHVDTYARNDRMQALFQKRGFRRVGAISLHGRPEPYPCFEKLIFPDKV